MAGTAVVALYCVAVGTPGQPGEDGGHRPFPWFETRAADIVIKIAIL